MHCGVCFLQWLTWYILIGGVCVVGNLQFLGFGILFVARLPYASLVIRSRVGGGVVVSYFFGVLA